ncbi:adenylate/guanylate cyclase domain-containing protein [Azospirillum sp. sgz302134]
MERSLALLFVDIADSTQLYERVGNLHAAALAQKVLAHLRLIIEANGGTVIKSLGDGLLAAFPTADDSARSALTMMEQQDAYRLRLRAGIHFGPVVQGKEDLYGDACNVAARVEAIARPGEILATDDLVQRLTPALHRKCRLLNSVSVKGKSLPIRVHQIRSTEEAEDAVESTTIGLTVSNRQEEHGMLTLNLTYRGTVVAMSRLLPRVTVGREESSGLRILSRQTSRQHAVIDFSRESFILADHSTNGTFIRTGESVPVVLRRDSTKLVGSGLIGFGAEPLNADQDHVVAFRGELA